MAYSVLRLSNSGGDHILYDSNRQQAILSGEEQEMYDWKDKLESAEQLADNAAYMNNLRQERLTMLISSGHTEETAEAFLRKEMPYLYAEHQTKMAYKVDCLLHDNAAFYTKSKKEAEEVFEQYKQDYGDLVRLYEAPDTDDDSDLLGGDVIDYYDVPECL